MSSNNSSRTTHITKYISAAEKRRRARLSDQEPSGLVPGEIYYNPISRYKEHIEVYGLTLYDIYRKPRSIAVPSRRSLPRPNTDDDTKDDVATGDGDATTLCHPVGESSQALALTTTTTATTGSNNNRNKKNKKNDTKIKSIKTLNSLFQCPICLGYMKKTFMVMECLHRFCGECIQKCLRVGKKECPSCRVHIPSRRSLRPDISFDDVIGKVYGVNDVEAMEEEKALEIETLNRERNMNNAYAESRQLGIMQQAFARQRKGSKPSTFSQTTSSSPNNNNTSSSTSRRQNTINRSNSTAAQPAQQQEQQSSSPQSQQPMIRISKLQDHSSPLIDFIVRKHPMEKVVDRLRKELLRTSKEMKVGQLKRFLGSKLNYQPWSHFQISIPMGGKLVTLDDSIKLACVFADVCDNNTDASLVFQYRIKLSL